MQYLVLRKALIYIFETITEQQLYAYKIIRNVDLDEILQVH